MPKRLLHIPKGLLKLSIFLLFLGAGVILALIRTQGGRDLLGRQIEHQFNQTFEGSLRIGRLYGNIARTFYATDVSIRDPEGRTVILVDSLVLQLDLLDGLRQRVTIRRANFLHPRFTLERNDSTGWNIERAFALRTRSESSSARWAFRSADVGIVDASVVTRNSGRRPAAVDSNRIFDFTNARLDGLNADATIEWSDQSRLVDLRQLRGHLTNQRVEFTRFRSQISITDSSVAINEAELATAASHVHLSMRLSGLDSVSALRHFDTPIENIVLNIDDATVDSTELSSLFPSLRLPSTRVQVLAGGSSDDLRVEAMSVAVGDARMEGKGRLVGWPDSLSFTLEVDEGVVAPDIAAHFLPTMRETLGRLPTHTFSGGAEGLLAHRADGGFEMRRAHVAVEATSDVGLLNGEIEISRTAENSFRASGQIFVSDFAAATWLPDLGATNLNGDLEFTLAGSSIHDLSGSIALQAKSSMVRGLSFDSLALAATANEGLIESELVGWGPDGDLTIRSSLNANDQAPRLEAMVRVRQFNALALASGSPRPGASAVSSIVDIVTLGDSPDNITGTATVVVDTATFFSGKDTLTLSPSRHRLAVGHPDTVSTRLELTGDVLEGHATGRFTFEPLIRSAKLWLASAAHTVSEQGRKRLHFTERLELEDVGEEAFALEEAAVRRDLAARGFARGMDFEASLFIKRLRDVHQVLPFVPDAARFAIINGAGHLSADSLSLSVVLDSDSLRGPNLAIDDLSLRAQLRGGYAYSLEDRISASVKVDLGILETGSQRLEDLAVDYSYQDETGSLRIVSSDSALGGLSIALDADLSILEDWNALRIGDVTVRKNEFVWSTHGTADIRLYGDALEIDRFEIRSLHNLGDFDRPEQALSLQGVISSERTDTLNIETRFVRLEELSELGRFQFLIGGEMHAQAAVASALRDAQTFGNVSINGLTFDGRDLGNLRLTSVYSSPAEGIAIDLRLTQPREKARGIQKYDAHIAGTVRLPGSEPDDHGNLNLAVDLPELDMFFFQYLFPNELAEVSGEGSGSGTITGDFTFPQFDASFQIDRSSFLVPEFNLRFGLTGPVTVDRSGFHLHDVSLTDPTGGQGSLRGDILFNEYRFFSFDIAADLAEIMIMNVSRSMDLSFYGQVWVSGSATLTGPLQQTLLRSTDAVTAKKSRLYLPVTEDEIESDKTFIVFADSTGEFQIEKRGNILSKRPQTERAFVEGMDMSFNILIPQESSVYLVFDALLGDVIHALGSGRVQLRRQEGDFQAFGTFTVESGDYLFTAGEVFQRRFILTNGGTITWDGDPIDARFDIPAVYRTRASLAGLPGQNPEDRVPIRVDMSLTGRVTTPIVDLHIALDQDERNPQVIPPGLESALNQSDLAVEYATSVLLTNTFLLTSNQGSDALTNTADDLLFHSLSQLVSSQLNRFVSQALNLDVNVGVQQGRTEEEYDVIYGFALRLDDERVVIRGEGLYETGTNDASSAQGIQGAFVVEYRLTPSVQLEFFFRRESDLYRAASSLGTAYGVGIVYQTNFANWSQFGRRSRGTKEPDEEVPPQPASVPASD